MVRPIPHPPSCLLFDLDGTFADTAPDMANAVNVLRAESNLPALPFAQIRPYVSQGARGMLGVGLDVKPLDAGFTELVRHFLNTYEKAICVESRVFAGVSAIVEHVEQQHIPWGIVTNKAARFTLPLMKALGWSERANIIVSGDTCARAKPYPDSLLYACEKLNCDPMQGIYVGDDLRDIEAAHAAGMIAVAVRYGYLGTGDHIEHWDADLIIDRPEELIALLKTSATHVS